MENVVLGPTTLLRVTADEAELLQKFRLSSSQDKYLLLELATTTADRESVRQYGKVIVLPTPARRASL